MGRLLHLSLHPVSLLAWRVWSSLPDLVLVSCGVVMIITHASHSVLAVIGSFCVWRYFTSGAHAPFTQHASYMNNGYYLHACNHPSFLPLFAARLMTDYQWWPFTSIFLYDDPLPGLQVIFLVWWSLTRCTVLPSLFERCPHWQLQFDIPWCRAADWYEIGTEPGKAIWSRWSKWIRYVT